MEYAHDSLPAPRRRVRRRRLVAALGAVAASLAGTALFASGAAAAPAGFVVADGARFAVSTGSGTEPWTPIGFNQYRLTSRPGGHVCDTGYGAIGDGGLGAWMDGVRASGANVVRTWFFQSMYDADGAGPGGGSWQAFDRVLDAARARGLRVIPVLVNHYSDCERSQDKTIGFYSGGFRQSGYGYSLSFKQYATTVAQRYRDDSTVAFWQLANEAEAPGGDCDENAAAAALRGFAAEMSAALHGVDPNHLVSLGTMGSGQCGAADGNYAQVHEPVDICEVHDYDSPAAAMPGDTWNGIARRLDQCGPNGLNKPIFVGEAGIAADVGASGNRTGTITPATLQARATFFRAKLEAQLAAGADGYLVWEHTTEASDSGFNRGPRGPYGVGPGDPVEDVLRAHATPAAAAGGWEPAGGPYAEAVLATAGLEGYWRLGEPQGMRTAVDSAGEADGTYSSGVAKEAGLISADPDPAAAFRAGARGSVEFGDTADFTGRRPFTVEAWVQPAATGRRAAGPLVTKRQRHWGGYALAIGRTGRVEFTLERRGRAATARGPRLQAAEGHHLVASFDGRVARLCVDGRCAASWSKRTRLALVDNAASLVVGADRRESFAGTIDEVAVYGTALGGAQSAAHAAAGRPSGTQ